MYTIQSTYFSLSSTAREAASTTTHATLDEAAIALQNRCTCLCKATSVHEIMIGEKIEKFIKCAMPTPIAKEIIIYPSSTDRLGDLVELKDVEGAILDNSAVIKKGNELKIAIIYHDHLTQALKSLAVFYITGPFHAPVISRKGW